MKRKIIFHLSGVRDEGVNILSGDKVYVAPGIDQNRTYENASLIELPSSEFEKSLCDQLVSKYSDFSPHDSTGMVFAFLNDFYSYSLRPFYSLLLSVVGLAEKYKDHELIVVTAKTDCNILPMFGFRTSESLRGSQDLIGSLVAEKLQTLPEMKRAEFRIVGGDLLCMNFFRIFLLRCADFLFSILFFLKVLKLGLGCRGSSSVETVVLFRNNHQARFAKNIILESEDMSFLFVPQLTQGAVLNLKKIRDDMPGYGGDLGVSFYEALRAYRKSRKLISVIRKDVKAASQKSKAILNVQNVEFEIDIAWIAKEVSRVSIAIFYKTILDELLEKYRPSKIVNFELVGRMAGIEAISAREHLASIRTVQTALISSRPHPVFPYSDYFYTDSEATKLLIKDIGSQAIGVVDYAGPAYKIKCIKKKDKPKKIVFYTQPYEISTTLGIVDFLAQWARRNSAKVMLKLHPRDSAPRYSDLVNIFSDVLSLSNNLELQELFEWSDVSITRTSSVAKESIANGCPAVLCLWSDFDKGIKSDYIKSDFLSGYCSFSESDLQVLMDSFESVANSNVLLHAELFGGKSIHDLIKALNDVGN